MGRRLFWAYFAAVHVALAAAVVAGDLVAKAAEQVGLRDRAEHPFIRDMRSAHARIDDSVPAGAVIFLGDSNVQAAPLWALPGAVNFGIGRQRSDQLLASMDAYRSLARASSVVVMIGTNDLAQGREAGLQERYRRILGKIPAGVPVILSSVPPMANRDTRAAVAAARAACATDPRCRFVDAHAALTGPGMLHADGAHLTQAGYAKLVQVWRVDARESPAAP